MMMDVDNITILCDVDCIPRLCHPCRIGYCQQLPIIRVPGLLLKELKVMHRKLLLIDKCGKIWAVGNKGSGRSEYGSHMYDAR